MRALRFLALIGLAACGLDVEGTSDLTADADVAQPGPATGQPDATVDGTTSNDGTIGADDVGVTPDAPRPDVCDSSEICTDGIDNDCNGAADCADPACATQGFACVPGIPSGFSLVAFDETHRNACPNHYGAPADLVVDPNTAPATCGCSCSLGTTPSCVTGSIQASYGSTNSCATGAGTYTNIDGACAIVNYTILAYVKTGKLPPTSGSCQANANTNVDNSSSKGRWCPASAPFGIGCSGGGVCAPSASGTFRACVAKAGDLACTAAGAYTTKHTVGSSVSDTRGCGACTCGAPSATCSNAAWNQYTSSDCSGTALPLTADGVCDLSNAGSATYRSTKYVATVQASCTQPPPPAPTGNVAIAGQQTVCCAP